VTAVRQDDGTGFPHGASCTAFHGVVGHSSDARIDVDIPFEQPPYQRMSTGSGESGPLPTVGEGEK